ncbi:unnamed protein product, partial [Iphiclides podalirius]
MESHGDLSNPRGLQGRLKSERLWCELAKLLNCIDGGVNKPTEKWKKVWADWKSKTKKKASVIRRRASGTGGGSSSRQTLTTFEERVLATMGKLAVEEQPSIQEQGFAVNIVLINLRGHHNSFHQRSSIKKTEFTLKLQHMMKLRRHHHSHVQLRHLLAGSQLKRLPGRGCNKLLSLHLLRPVDNRYHRLCSVRAMRKFVAVEQQRLRVEERRDRQLHERETQRIEVDHERNQILRSFADIAQACLDHFRSRHNAEH